MRKLILALAMLTGLQVHAAKIDAATELANYRAEIAGSNYIQLIGYQGVNISKMSATCALSMSLTGAAFISDTIPLTNPVAEWLGNKTNRSYKTYDILLSWETLADAGRGAAGGGLVAGYEFFDYLVKFAAGEQMDWANLKKVYASSFAVAESVFSEDSRCIVNLAKIAAVRMEWRRALGYAPYTPMNLPR